MIVLPERAEVLFRQSIDLVAKLVDLALVEDKFFGSFAIGLNPTLRLNPSAFLFFLVYLRGKIAVIGEKSYSAYARS